MTTTAAGCITKAEQLLKDTLAACSTFQTWVSAASAVAAAEHIYLEAAPLDDPYDDRYELQRLLDRRPYAIISTAEANGVTWVRAASPNTVTSHGTLHLELWQNLPESVEENLEEADRLWKNTVGQIIQSGSALTPGLVELSSTAGYLDWESISLVGWYRTRKNDTPTLGDAQMAMIQIEWGTRT